MEKHGFIIHNSHRYEYEIDEQGFVWLLIEPGKTNIGQVKPVNPLSDIERILHEMLDGGGY